METRKSHWSFGLVIVMIAFFQFSNTLGHDFAWDDKIVILENDRVQEGVSGIPNLLKKYTSDLRKDQYGYRPVTLISFAIDYELSKLNPSLYHFMNVVYFSLLCLVLFLVLKRLFHRSSPLLAFLITVLFVVHPIHTEVVANIKSRDEILALLFCLISLLQLIKFVNHKHWKHLVFTVIFFTLAFLSKENSIVFIPIYLLTLIQLTDLNWKRVLAIAGIILPIGLIIVYFISSYALNSQLGKNETAELGVYQENFILGNAFFFTDHFVDKLANASYLVLLYVKDFIAPFNLAYYHGQGDIESIGLSWQAIPGLLVSASALFFAIFQFKKYPKIAYGIFFFFFSLSIYLHVIKTLSDTRADRFLFFGSIGLSIILIVAVSRLLKVDFSPSDEKNRLSLSAAFGQLTMVQKVTFISIFAIFSAITFSRNGVWENDYTLVENDMERLDSSARPHYFYATNLLQDLQKNGPDADKEDRMIYHYKRSMDLSDSIYHARIELGGYFISQGKMKEGIDIFEETVRLFPRTSDPRHYLGQAYFQIASYSKATEQLEKSIEYAPKSLDSYYLLAISYGKTGKFEEGIELADKGLKKFPEGQLSMYEALGHIYFDKNEMSKSTEYTLKMIEHGGDPYTIYATIIGRYQEKGDEENAARYYRSAIQQGIMRQ